MKRLMFIFLASFFINCNYQSQKAKLSEVSDNKSLEKMNILEKFFNNDNWMKIKGSDTSYYYFSRNNLVTKVYIYKIIKGDSINTALLEIKILNDSLSWHYNDTTQLFLSLANNKKLEWKKPGKRLQVAPYISFEKTDSLHIIAIEENTKFNFTKTLPLSSFLVRSHYDYLHGTRLAFSDTSFILKRTK